LAISPACFAFLGLPAVLQLDHAFAHEIGLYRVVLAARFEPLDYVAQRSYVQVSLRKFAIQHTLAHASLLECAFYNIPRLIEKAKSACQLLGIGFGLAA
jgi:hypothetical protein